MNLTDASRRWRWKELWSLSGKISLWSFWWGSLALLMIGRWSLLLVFAVAGEILFLLASLVSLFLGMSTAYSSSSVFVYLFVWLCLCDCVMMFELEYYLYVKRSLGVWIKVKPFWLSWSIENIFRLMDDKLIRSTFLSY